MKLDNPSLFFDTSRKMFRAKKELFVSIPRLAVVGVSDWITDEGHKAPIFQNAKFFNEYTIGLISSLSIPRIQYYFARSWG